MIEKNKDWSIENEELRKSLVRNKILLYLILFLLVFGIFSLLMLIINVI